MGAGRRARLVTPVSDSTIMHETLLGDAQLNGQKKYEQAQMAYAGSISSHRAQQPNLGKASIRVRESLSLKTRSGGKIRTTRAYD